jgi:hypothetical protein
VARSILITALLVTLYFTLPFTHSLDTKTWFALVAGLIGVAALVAYQVREITVSPYPRLRAIQALATSVPLFLLVFATTFYLLGKNNSGSFSQHLTRFDAIYFTVTVFATVGFGDITPVTETARIATTIQMIGDIVLVGLVAKVLFGAVQVGLQRRKTPEPSPAHSPAPHHRHVPTSPVVSRPPRRLRPSGNARRPRKAADT